MTDAQDTEETVIMESSAEMKSSSDVAIHSMSDNLSRWVRISSFQWLKDAETVPNFWTYASSTSVTPGLYNGDFPHNLLSSSEFLTNKLANFRYLKCDMEFELKVNANPFHSGGLVMYWMPMYNFLSPASLDTRHYRAGVTSLPHVILNLASGNSAKLRVPYAFYQEYLDLTESDTAKLSFGRLFVHVMVPLRDGNTGIGIACTLFARMVDPIWNQPVANSLTPIRKQFARSLLAEAQGETRPIMRASESGEGTSKGPVSTVMGGVAQVATGLSSIPVLGRVMSNISWAARCAAGVASIFGYSKATDLAQYTTVSIKSGHNMYTVEGKDNSTTLALIQDNTVECRANPMGADEMCFRYLTSRECTTSLGLFDGVSPPSFQLNKYAVSPLQDELATTSTIFCGTMLGACLQARQWRGSIVFRFEFFKTQYHNGRIAIVYFPDKSLPQVPLSLGHELTTNYNMVYDLNAAQKCDITFEVPYSQAVPWLDTVLYHPTTGDVVAGSLDTSNGSIGVYVLNQLQAPDTVHPDVFYTVSYRGGDDFELSIPEVRALPGYSPNDSSPASISVETFAEEPLAEAQSDIVPIHTSNDVKTTTTGEYYTSLRQFIKRFSRVVEYNYSTLQYSYSALPMLRSGPGRRVRWADTPREYRNTPISVVATMFVFYNGSIRYKLFSRRDLLYIGVAPVMDDAPQDKQYGTINEGVLDSAYNGPVEVTSPYYGKYACRLTMPNSTYWSHFGLYPKIRVETSARVTSLNQCATLSEAAGDDLNFYYCIGPGPMHNPAFAKNPSIV